MNQLMREDLESIHEKKLYSTDEELLQISKAGIEKFIETIPSKTEREKALSEYDEIVYQVLERMELKKWRRGKIPLGDIK